MEKLRRDLLTLLPLAAGSALLIRSGADKLVQSPPFVMRSQNDPDRFIADSIPYREHLGYQGVSEQAIEAKIRRRSSFREPATGFENRFPPSIYSYGVISEFYGEQTLSDISAPHLFKGAEVNTNKPYEYAWQPGTKFLNLAHNAGLHFWTDYHPLGWSIYGFLAHEVAGHATDTYWLANDYPYEVFAQMEYNKWKMLAQSYNITGPLTENEGTWKLNSGLPYDFGYTVAKKWVEEGTVKVNNKEFIDEIVRDLAHQQGAKDACDLRFNKDVCLQFGRRLIDKMRSGQLVLGADLKKAHEEASTAAFREVYAEMWVGMLINPDLINNNPEVIAGGMGIMNALRRDKVSLEQIRIQSQKTPRSIEQMRRAEIKEYSVPPPVIEVVAADPVAFTVEKTLQHTMGSGRFGLPNDLHYQGEDRQLVDDYIHAVTAVYTVYDELTNLNPHKSRRDFAPQRAHAWDAIKVDIATDPDKLRSLIKNGYIDKPLSDEERQKIKKNTAFLHTFISSDAFGS